jgi:hypothetical protein
MRAVPHVSPVLTLFSFRWMRRAISELDKPDERMCVASLLLCAQRASIRKASWLPTHQRVCTIRKFRRRVAGRRRPEPLRKLAAAATIHRARHPPQKHSLDRAIELSEVRPLALSRGRSRAMRSAATLERQKETPTVSGEGCST